MNLLFRLAAYTAIGTILAQLLMLGWLWKNGHFSADRRQKIVLALQGVDSGGAQQADEANEEQPSLDDVARQRALQSQQLLLREEALRRGLENWRNQLAQLTEEKQRILRLQAAFAAQLKEIQDQASGEGEENARVTIERSKPREAKRLLREMLQKGEMDEVVNMLGSMPPATRVRIAAEFKTPEEVAEMDEVLRRMRQGVPEKPLADKTLDQLQRDKPAP